MSVQCRFSFCVISDLGIEKTVTGKVVVTETNLGIAVTRQFADLPARTWTQQAPDLFVDVTLPDDRLRDCKWSFDITCQVNDDDAICLFFNPEVVHDTPFRTSLILEHQSILDTGWRHEQHWHNLPIRHDQQARALFHFVPSDSLESVIPGMSSNVDFAEVMTYHQPSTTRTGMTLEQNIEYYLGKDRLKNLYFGAEIPGAWAVPTRDHEVWPAQMFDTTLTGFFTGDTVQYRYNNLGYRSHLDFDKNQSGYVILCLGDSDTFGVGVEYQDTWPSILQQQTDAIVWNMSVPGISNDGLARIGAQAIQALGNRVKSVLIHYAPLSLREFVSKKYKGGVHTHRNYKLPYQDWWTHIDWQSNNYDFHKNKLLLHNLCKAHDIEFHDLYINKNDKKIPFDLVHYGVYTSFGPATHQAMANYFLKCLNKEPSFFESIKTQS